MSYLVALLKSLSLILLVVIPYVVYRWSRTNWPTRTGILTGATLGLVVSPVSLGLYFLGFLLPLIGMLPALIGGTLAMFHGAPGYELSILLGFQEPGVVVHGLYALWIQEVLNGVFWSAIYAGVGFFLDKKFLRYAPTT